MKILNGIEIKGKALWIKKEKVLIIADLHMGYEEALAKDGFLVVQTMFKEIEKEIKELLKLKPKLIIINGDLKHEFGSISNQEWTDSLAILDLLLKESKVILVKGNHDTILEPIARKRNLEIVDYYILDGIAILHGQKIFFECLDKKIKTLIIGHDHPAVSLREGVKYEKFKCFLLGNYQDKKIIVMPSFFTINEGSDILQEKMLSPFLKDLKNFEVFIVGDKIYKFGKVKNI
jgi:uncharacterized protein